MQDKQALHGLNCPNCGGTIQIPEGQRIVCCPYCNLRSLVKGERGMQRYQVSPKVNREQALNALQGFLKSNWAIARNAPQQARISEAVLVYLPFWAIWGRVAGWVFGTKRIGSGKNVRYEPREIRVVEEVTWNGAACDVGEFGVTQVLLAGRPLDVYAPELLHNTGLVFEPVGSLSDAQQAAEQQVGDLMNRKANLSRISQTFVRTFQRRLGLVYYPMWVMRYTFRGRTFQVVIDAHSGQVLYGKAPGNTLYRAGALVAGMAIGAFMAVDVPAFILGFLSDSSEGEGLLLFALGALVIGLGIMGAAFRSFRFGEEYEYRLGGKTQTLNPDQILTQAREVEKWISQLS